MSSLWDRFMGRQRSRLALEELHRELTSQWRQLVDDPQGPRHYCESRLSSIHGSYGTHSIVRLATNHSILEMDVMPHVDAEEVGRWGDLLVGVVLRGPERPSVRTCTVDVKVNGKTVCALDLYTDKPRLVLGGQNVLPLICLPYHTVRLVSRGDETVELDLIYGNLRNKERRDLATNHWSLQVDGRSWLHVEGGLGRVDTHGPRHPVLPPIPDDEPWMIGLERQKDRLRVYEEELVAATWHPSRFQEWCLDMTE